MNLEGHMSKECSVCSHIILYLRHNTSLYVSA